jgi:hypothetical protein
MLKFASVLSVALLGFGYAALAAQSVPAKDALHDFQSGNVSWTAINSDFTGVPGGPQPVTFDAKYPFLRNDQAIAAKSQATYRVADTSNPNLKPWVVAELKRYNEKVLAGEIGATPRWSCMPGGVPGFSIFVVEAVFIVQGPKEVLLVYSGNHEVRHVYLDMPHGANPTPSWYGESVGHYEGDTLVVDTIGLNAKTFVDNYRTPHTEQLHVVERFRMVDGARTMEVRIHVEDEGAFTTPWNAIQRFARFEGVPGNPGTMVNESICAEGGSLSRYDAINYGASHATELVPIPQSDRPDF